MPHERTYHIFYQIFAGASNQILNNLMLNSNNQYNFLGNDPPVRKIKQNDATDFFDVIHALSEIGFGLKLQNDVFRLLAAILHMGNFEFKSSSEDEKEHASSLLVESTGVNFVSSVLGLPVSELGPALTSRTIKSIGRKSFYSVPLSVDQVSTFWFEFCVFSKFNRHFDCFIS